MKDEILRNIEFDFVKELNYVMNYNKDLKRINELFNNKNVIEYVNHFNKSKFQSIPKNEDINRIFLNAFNKNLVNIKENETNKIFVYLGNYYVKYFGGSLQSARLCQTLNDSDKVEYKKYQDLEQSEPIYISIDKCSDFENNNYVIFNNALNYLDIRSEFASNILFNGQDKAKDILIKKYVKK